MKRFLVPALALALVVVTTALALVLLARGPSTTADPSGDAADDLTCTPTSTRPGPLLDLGVQAGTGDREAPLLPAVEVRRLVALASRAGADVVSTDVSWETVQPTPGAEPDFKGLDLVVDAAERHGLAVRVQLTGSPAWAVPGSGDSWRPPVTGDQLARWRAFVALVLRHLDGRAAYVEVWGEPDEPDSWGGSPDPAQFARLLRTTEPVVRRFAPDAVLVSGGLGGNEIGYLEQLYDALGRSRPFDLVGVHPFAGALPPSSQSPSARTEDQFGAYDRSFLGHRALHEVMEAAGDGDRGLYLGEFGYSTKPRGGDIGTPDALRATYAAQALGVATCTPYVVALSWYYLHPTPWDDPSWTLVDEQGETSATFDALASWTATRP